MKEKNNNEKGDEKTKEKEEKKGKKQEQEGRLDEPPEQDPFDLKNLRLSQDFSETVGVKKHLITVPVRPPHKQSFIRVHPDESFRLETAVLEVKEERETYLVDRGLWSELSSEIVPVNLYTTITRQAVVFLWSIRLPGPDGRHNPWHRSALEAAQVATKTWIRVVANMYLGAYEVLESTGNVPEPVWPDVSFQDLLKIAFRDKFIQGLDHPAIRALQGEL